MRHQRGDRRINRGEILGQSASQPAGQECPDDRQKQSGSSREILALLCGLFDITYSLLQALFEIALKSRMFPE